MKLERNRMRTEPSSSAASRPSAGRWVLLACLGLAACQSAPLLAPVNLNAPGWSVRHGQAVWQPSRRAPEIAGELLVAQRPGETFVQFTKSPLTLVEAQTSPASWSLHFPPRQRSYSGTGAPPARTAWLQLGPVLTGQAPASGWQWQQKDARWQLENPARGESLEGVFLP